jgi:hypothetical protein
MSERERERARMHTRQAYDHHYMTCNDKQWYSISSLGNHSKHTHTHKFHFLNPDVMIEKFSIILGQCMMQISDWLFIINIQWQPAWQGLKQREDFNTKKKKKCIHSLLINIFGINLNENSISGWECNIMFSQQMAQALHQLHWMIYEKTLQCRVQLSHWTHYRT